MQYKSYTYENTVQWDHNRRGFLRAPGLPEFSVTAPAEFKGHSDAWTPEHLFVAALNTCFWLTYVGLAERKALKLIEFKSRAEGLLEFRQNGYEFTRVDIYPDIQLFLDDEVRLGEEVAHEAEKSCLVAKSVSCTVKIHPLFKIHPVRPESDPVPAEV